MDSTELYRQLLGVTTPWTVERVDMDVAHLRVDVHLVHASGARFACPECGAELGVYDHTEERVWRHLDSCHFQTLLHARPPRVQCPEHGVLRAKLPWAEPGGRFTNLFEALAIDVLLATDVKKAATILGITWDEAWHIMERAVRRGRAAKDRALPQVIGVDEKAIAKGHRYMTLVCDLELLNYTKHRITNAAAEGFNSIIQTIKANARGFRSFDNFRVRILFFCGKLDLMPANARSH